MVYLNTILCIVFFIALIKSESLANSSQSHLDQINFKCSRRCDSHFSDANCWENSFEYFSNSLIQSIVQYKNAVSMTLNNGISEKESESLLKLENLFNEQFKKFEENSDDKKMFQDSKMKDFVNDLKKILNDTVKKLSTKSTSQTNRANKCPDTCSLNALVIWQSLFGCFIGLTLMTVVFVISYTILKKIQHQQHDEKSAEKTLFSSK